MRKKVLAYLIIAYIIARILDILLSAISTASTQIANYKGNVHQIMKPFDQFFTLMYAIGVVFGLTGAVKVYLKWNRGSRDIIKVAASWFGSCIFLVISTAIFRHVFMGLLLNNATNELWFLEHAHE